MADDKDPRARLLEMRLDIVAARARRLREGEPAPRPTAVPAGWEPLEELSMSNYNHGIADGLDEALRQGGCWASHFAVNFCGHVWFADGHFHEEVWQYHVPREVLSAPTLPELMTLVNNKYGAD